MEKREDLVCKLCLKEKSKYTCPRCNVQYCSLECYKSEKHIQCSEHFYKDCCIEGLKEFTTSKEEKQKILEMLQRVEDEDSYIDSDDDEENLEDRLEGLDLDHDTKEVWDKLTNKEKKEFEKLMQGGELSTLLEIWTPWWNNKKLVEELEDKATQKKLPDIKEDIPDITSLLKKGKPSADIKNNVVNVLYAYCFICRLYNGDHLSFPTEASKEALSVSQVLNENAICGSPSEAVQICLQCLQNRTRDNLTTQQFNLSIIEDVINVIQGPSPHNPLQFILAALSDLLTLFQKALVEIDSEKKKCKVKDTKTDYRAVKKRVFTGIKKIEFLLSWSQRCGMALLSTVPQLQLEFCALTSDLAEVHETKQKVEQVKKEKELRDSKKLIQEI